MPQIFAESPCRSAAPHQLLMLPEECVCDINASHLLTRYPAPESSIAMSYLQTIGSSPTLMNQHQAWAMPTQPQHPTGGHTNNTAILPTYWVSVQWMVPSGSSAQSQSQSTPDPSLMPLVAHGARVGLSSAPKRINASPGNDQRLELLPREIPSAFNANRQDLHRHSSHPTAPSGSGRSPYSQTPLRTLSTGRPSLDPLHTVPQQPDHDPILPKRTPLWNYESRQRPQLIETRSDGRLAATYGERRHKAHLVSEKRRRE